MKGKRKKKISVRVGEDMRFFKILEVSNCYIEIRSYTLNFLNLWIACAHPWECVCLCMCVSYLFFCVCFCVSVLWIDLCVWERARENDWSMWQQRQHFESNGKYATWWMSFCCMWLQPSISRLPLDNSTKLWKVRLSEGFPIQLKIYYTNNLLLKKTIILHRK